MNHTWPLASRIVKPGVTPSLFAAITVHGPAAGPVVVSGPFNSSSTVIGRAPIRFVNQLESGTSSTVLTFWARTLVVGSPGFVEQVFQRVVDQIDLAHRHA